MTNVEQSFTSYKDRIKGTFHFSIFPLSLLISLFSVKGDGDYGNVLRGLSVFFGVLSSPVLLLATPVTITLGVVAAIAQTVWFPFQLLYSAVLDVVSSSALNSDDKTNLRSPYDGYEERADDLAAHDFSVTKGEEPQFSYASLYTKKETMTDSQDPVVSLEQSMSL